MTLHARMTRVAVCVAALLGCTPATTDAPGSGGGTGSGSGGQDGTGAGTGGTAAPGTGGSPGGGTGGSGGGGRMGGGSGGSGGVPGGAGGVPGGGSGGAGGAGGRGSGGSGGAGGAGGRGSGGAGNTGGSAGAPGTGGGSAGRGGGGTGGAGGSVGGMQYWIGPGGLDTNPGTEAQPFQTLSRAHEVATAGTTIWVAAGNYSFTATVTLSKSGTAAAPIRILAGPGSRPVLDFSRQTRGDSGLRGLQFTGDYWQVKGIEIAKAADNCIAISGSHNLIENVVVHECGDTGIQITVESTRASDDTRGADNTVLNCDSYGNLDTTTNGENADGFAAKLRIGAGNVFRGCRAWNNADDGWDFFASNDVVVVDGCWAFENGRTLSGGGTTNGDGNGFKLGGTPTPGDPAMGGAVHLVTNSFAFENVNCGFTRNANPSVPSITTSGGRGDGLGECCSLPANCVTVNFTLTAAEAKTIARNADGSLPPIR